MYLNVTTKGRYALRVMLDLARHREEGIVPLKSVAERQGISLKYLEAIVASLRRAGLVESARGKEGGYQLSREPVACTAGEILRCTEESLAPVACIRGDSEGCERAASCPTLPMWKELDALTENYLDGVTLLDLLTGERWKNT